MKYYNVKNFANYLAMDLFHRIKKSRVIGVDNNSEIIYALVCFSLINACQTKTKWQSVGASSTEWLTLNMTSMHILYYISFRSQHDVLAFYISFSLIVYGEWFLALPKA